MTLRVWNIGTRLIHWGQPAQLILALQQSRERPSIFNGMSKSLPWSKDNWVKFFEQPHRSDTACLERRSDVNSLTTTSYFDGGLTTVTWRPADLQRHDAVTSNWLCVDYHKLNQATWKRPFWATTWPTYGAVTSFVYGFSDSPSWTFLLTLMSVWLYLARYGLPCDWISQNLMSSSFFFQLRTGPYFGHKT